MFAKLESLEMRYQDIEHQLMSQDVISDQDKYRKLTKAHADLREIVDQFRAYRNLIAREQENRDLLISMGADRLEQMFKALKAKEHDIAHYCKGGFQALTAVAQSMFSTTSADYRSDCMALIQDREDAALEAGEVMAT